MPMLLPNLDDRRWVDLVDEGRALIPLYVPEWTDQNAHDPGITMIELLAALAEMDIYQVNRITDRARLKFLAAVGIHPLPPLPATTVLSFSYVGKTPDPLVVLEPDIECAYVDDADVETRFRTLAPVTVLPLTLMAIQIRDANGFRDLTDRTRRGVPFGAFGDVPQVGNELYLGFDAPLVAGRAHSLFFTFASPHAGMAERLRIAAEAEVRQQACTPVVPRCATASQQRDPTPSQRAAQPVAPLAAVRLACEMLVGDGVATRWMPLGGSAFADDTRYLTLDGGIVIIPSLDGVKQRTGHVDAELSYLRIRFEAGAYDAPPIITNLALNAVRAEQASHPGVATWSIPAGVASPPAAPEPWARMQLQFDSGGRVAVLEFVQDPAIPPLRILDYAAASATTAGRLSIEAVALGTGDGTPWQQMRLPVSPVKRAGFRLLSLDQNGLWQCWRDRRDFDGSHRDQYDFVLDPSAGLVSFGDGEHGRVAAAGVQFFAACLETRAQAGNLRARTVDMLVDSPHNRALITGFDSVKKVLLPANPLAATGGAMAETLALASGRAIEMLARPQRAITLGDYEMLAKATPGVEIARVKAWADRHADFPCIKASGMVTIVVLPNMPVPRPTPGPALLRAVSAYLGRRRIIGSRIDVVGPAYRVVTVQAQVQPLAGTSPRALAARIVDALDVYLHPLTGGADGQGWPFGRSVFRAEIMQVIDSVPGVDYVATLALLADGCACDPQCGNVCIASTALVESGAHEIQVL